MAVIRDMIPAFELFQPTSVDEAIEILDRYGRGEAWVLAGGLDSLDWFKDRIKRPEAVVELGSVSELKGINGGTGGLEIGALTPLAEVARHADIIDNFAVLSDAASQVATPQIRNQGTLGGNLIQDTRCWYYRGGWPCYRAGGNICYAGTPKSMNREHAVMGQSRCVAVNGSDTAPALIALDAQMVIRGSSGERIVDAEDFFVGPAIDIQRMTVIEPGELLVSIRIPGDWAGARFYWEKVRDRQSWDWALASVASAMFVSGGTIERARIAVNGVAPTPVRLTDVENIVRGQPLSDGTIDAAGELAIRGSRPLRHNDFKLPLTRNLVRRAVRGEA
ncbi:MAG: xanthine dehydrogenase family protein subunit M [Gemmatimonadota bacterium]|nr:xanthine dehydrogenase family protein subunit M [Gemmatimonadota bacterium]